MIWRIWVDMIAGLFMVFEMETYVGCEYSIQLEENQTKKK